MGKKPTPEHFLGKYWKLETSIETIFYAGVRKFYNFCDNCPISTYTTGYAQCYVETVDESCSYRILEWLKDPSETPGSYRFAHHAALCIVNYINKFTDYKVNADINYEPKANMGEDARTDMSICERIAKIFDSIRPRLELTTDNEKVHEAIIEALRNLGLNKSMATPYEKTANGKTRYLIEVKI